MYEIMSMRHCMGACVLEYGYEIMSMRHCMGVCV